MKTIHEQLLHIRQYKKIGLMTHVVIGFPTIEMTERIVMEMAEAGVDFIELQIPFSDPLADGPTIMMANDVALQNGVTLQDCFACMNRLSKKVNIPLLFMAYYQSVFHVGADEFCRQAREVGAQGLIIPDIPIDEEFHEHFIESCEKYGLHHIRLLSPSSTHVRLKLNAAVQNGFVYCTSRNGITGADNALSSSLKDYLTLVKKYIHVPVAVGFGISQPTQIAALVGNAEIAVVGSAVIDRIVKEGVESVPKYINHLLSEVR